MILRLFATLATILAILVPRPAMAQVPFPPRVADSIAGCVTGNIPSLLSEAAFTEQIPDGWRVLIPLAGQPPEPLAQTPPPTEDTLAWMDLYLFPSLGAVPPEVNDFDSFVVVTATGGAMVALHDGYFMMIIRSVGRQCVEHATGGRFVPR